MDAGKPGAPATRPRARPLLLALVVLLAAAVRFQPLIRHPERERNGYGSFGDTQLYHRIAANLVRGNGFSATDDGSPFGGFAVEVERYEPAITRPPVYPFFMAGVYSLAGDADDTRAHTWRSRWNAVRFVQSGLDALACVLVFFLARTMAPGSRWAPLVAALAYALGPYNAYYARALLSECVSAFLVTASLLSTIVALRRGTWLAWLAAGALWGLTALGHPQLVLFPGLLAAWLFLRARGARRAGLRAGLLCVGGVLLVLAPWLARNALVFQRPFTISVSPLWSSLFIGSFETDENWRGWNVLPEELFPDAAERADIQSRMSTLLWHLNRGHVEVAELDRGFRPLVLRALREHPGRTLLAWIDGVPRLWYQDPIPMHRDREASGLFFLAYLALAVYALLRASRAERSLMAPVALLVAYLTLIFLPLHVEARYSVTAMPGLIAVAGVGLARLIVDALERWRSRQPGRRSKLPTES